jgi:hypothetical protein
LIVELPAVDATNGTASPPGGVLVFGIDTESNNSSTGITRLLGDPASGVISATLNSTTYPNSYIDSGSNANFFASTLPNCPSPNQGFYCPASTTLEHATLTDTHNDSLAADFSVANANTLFGNASSTAFNDLAGTNTDPTALDLGLSFFFGRNVFTGFENLNTSSPPYFAYANGAQTIASAAANVEPLMVDTGPAGLSPSAVNTAFISVKVCVPGTMTCQTIDHVEVDTGSIGLRLISSVVTVSLPALTDSSSRPLAECLQFADGTAWGSLATADIVLPVSGLTAQNVRVHLIGAASAGSPPSACTGKPENTVSAFGANGILGVGPFVNDCNSSGSCAPGPQAANYYYCH